MGLPPYKAETRCPKCDHDDIGTTYHENTHAWGCVLRRMTSKPECCELEHQERTCRRCHYVWAEGVA